MSTEKQLESAVRDGYPSSSSNDDGTSSIHTESTDVPKRSMGVIQVASLIINQMIGQGIFSTPAVVLFLTRSKGLSLGLWAIGGLYTFMNAFIYLEYGNAFPFNGGPLIYLDEVFHWPKLFASVIFSTYWILFATAGGSSAFSQYVLSLASPGLSPKEINPRLQDFTQVMVSGLICLALYFRRRFVLMLNHVFATFKICVLLSVAIGGFIASRAPDSGVSDFRVKQPGFSGFDALSAMIYIIYSFEGWEYANYVSGEISAPKRTLKVALLGSIGIVVALDMLVTCAYYVALDFETIQTPTNLFGLAPTFATKVFGDSKGLMGAVSISALSNAIATTYAQVRVKQAIAWQRFIPFSRFIGHQSRTFDSPGGALLLHWVVQTVVTICVPSGTEDYNFGTGIFTYGYIVMMLFLGIGLFRLKGRMRQSYPLWEPKYFTNRWVLYVVGSIFIGFNALMLYAVARPQVPGTVPRYYWPVVMACILALGSTYWLGLKLLQSKVGRKIGIKLEFTNEHLPSDDSLESLQALIDDPTNDGAPRRGNIQLLGIAARVRDCARDGRQRFEEKFGWLMP